PRVPSRDRHDRRRRAGRPRRLRRARGLGGGRRAGGDRAWRHSRDLGGDHRRRGARGTQPQHAARQATGDVFRSEPPDHGATLMTIDATNTRRTFIAGLTTLGAGALLYGSRSTSLVTVASAAAPHRIDVHHHFGPPSYVAAMAAGRVEQRQIVEWTPAKSLEDMDKAGVATAVLSIAAAGFSFTDLASARRL